MTERKQHGPTGPNQTWQEGDHYATVGGCVELTVEQVNVLNEQLAEHRAKVQAGELTRLPHDQLRPCPKCGVRLGPMIVYRGEGADCQEDHGHTEHYDKQCHACFYLWAEQLP